MSEEDPLDLIEKTAKHVVQLLITGKIDPHSALSFYRRTIHNSYPKLGNNFIPELWDFMYARFNSYILLMLLKMQSVEMGYRVGDPEEISIDKLYDEFIKELKSDKKNTSEL